MPYGLGSRRRNPMTEGADSLTGKGGVISTALDTRDVIWYASTGGFYKRSAESPIVVSQMRARA